MKKHVMTSSTVATPSTVKKMNSHHSLASQWHCIWLLSISLFLTCAPSAKALEIQDYTQWLGTVFTVADQSNPAISGLDADPDSDGLKNLLEYALALHPNVPDIAGMPTGTLVSGRMAIVYTKRKFASDLNYIAQTGTDLLTWSSGASFTAITNTQDQGATFKITETCLPGLPVSPRRFMRMQIQRVARPFFQALPTVGANPVLTDDTSLSVFGADDQPESGLTYTWSSLSGPAPVTFTINGTNAAKESGARFTLAGTYTLQVVIRDVDGNTSSASIAIQVLQTPTLLKLTPEASAIAPSSTLALTAQVKDQFGVVMTPALTWQSSGGGTVNTSGQFTAGALPGGPFAVSATVSTTAGPVEASAMVVVSGSAQTYKYAVKHDLGGNVKRIDETYSGGLSNRVVEMIYDAGDRMTEEKTTVGSVVTTTTYGYDNANNRDLKQVVTGAVTTTTNYFQNSRNQLTSFTEGARNVSYGYDDNGNRTSRTEGADVTNYSWDRDNRLLGVTRPGLTTSYVYDYRTRRVERNESGVVTKIAHSGGTSAFEVVNAATTVEYVRGSDMGGGIGGILYSLRGGQPSYAHYNNRGDVVARTNASRVTTYQAAY